MILLEVADLSVEIIHHLGCLDEFILVGVTELSELVDILSRANFQRHLNSQWLSVDPLKRLLIIVLCLDTLTNISAGHCDVLVTLMIHRHVHLWNRNGL